jgi:ankyrin repeat protein
MLESDTQDHRDAIFRDAILRSDVPMVGAMLAKGINVASSDEKGRTPLMFAAEAGSPVIVELLLAAGADPFPKDDLGYSAEMIANWYGEWRMGAYTPESKEIVQLLRKAAARHGAG